MVYADLHVHTNYSDGTHSIEEVIRLAKNRGIKVVAITDHDTLYHYDKVKKICEKNKNLADESGLGIQAKQVKPLWDEFERRVLALAKASYDFAWLRADGIRQSILHLEDVE